MPEVEGDPQLRVERAERQGQEPLVARRPDEDADRAEPLAEQSDSLLERRGLLELVRLHLHGEAEGGRRLLGPTAELVLGRNPVAGRVQLDARQALCIVAEELPRLHSGRVEAGAPRRIGPAGSADIEPRYTRLRGRHTRSPTGQSCSGPRSWLRPPRRRDGRRPLGRQRRAGLLRPSQDEMDDSDAGLIRFLMRERHGTPFEHSSFRFHIRAPIFIAREWFRHRVGLVQRVQHAVCEGDRRVLRPRRRDVRSQVGKPGAYSSSRSPKT